jgi:hypothetical protein
MAGANALGDKVLIDVSNPLDFSKGMPPTLFVTNTDTDSLGEQIQRKFPKTKVVKALNTLNCAIMVKPALVPGEHNLFICGDDAGAKAKARSLIVEAFGWKPESFIDLGDISMARGTEGILPLWIRLWGALGHANFNFRIVTGKP